MNAIRLYLILEGNIFDKNWFYKVDEIEKCSQIFLCFFAKS